MAGKRGGRLLYADLLRVCATLAVVFLHISAGWISEVAVGSPPWNVFNLYDSLVRWSVPVFVMLSGMFLLDPEKHLTLRSLLFRHTLRIVAALVVWSVIYELYALFLNGDPITPAACLAAVRNILWGKLHYHLWFLPMIVGLYLFTPVLRAFVRGAERSDYHWYFLLVFLVAMVLPTLLNIRPSETLSAWLSKLSLPMLTGYAGYYVLGYYLKTWPLSRPARMALYVLGLAGAAVTVVGTYRLSLRAGSSDYTLYSYFSPAVALTAAALFVFFRSLPLEGERPWISRLSAITFGIYLCHDLFIMLLRRFGVSTLSSLPALSVPLLALGVFLCAAMLAWLVSKIPLLGRFIT